MLIKKDVSEIQEFFNIEDVLSPDEGKTHIVFQVLNAVVGDSRVIKVAKTAIDLGYRVTMLGMSRTRETIWTEIEGINVILIENPTYPLLKKGRHEPDMSKRNYKEFIDQYVESSKDILCKLKPDLLHTHDMYGIEIGYLYKKILGDQGVVIPWVHDIHEYVLGLDHLPSNIQQYTESFESNRIFDPDFLFTVTDELAEKLYKHYRLPATPAIITNSPKLSYFKKEYKNTIKKSIGLSNEECLAVYVGRVSVERGIESFLRAMIYVDNLHLAVVSNQQDKYREHLLNMADKLGLSDRFHIKPYVPNEDVSSYIQDADLGISPLHSYGNSNVSIPTKVSEYIHAGIPVVSSKLEAMEKFMTTHKIGELHEPENEHEIAEAVKKVLSNRKRYVENITPQLKYERSWDKAEDLLKDAYDALLHEYSDGNRGTMRIFHGFSGAANQPSIISKAQKALGFKSDFGCFSAGNKMRYERDFEMYGCAVQYNIPFHLNKLAKKYDIFHYYFRTFYQMPALGFPTGMDVLALKADRKTMIMTFQGSEIRFHSQFKTECPFNYVDENPDNLVSNFPENQQRAFVNFCKSVFDEIVVLDPEMQRYVPEAKIINRAVDTEYFANVGLVSSENEWREAGPHIVHIPSRSTVKGSHYIQDALDQLEKDGVRFRYTFASGLSHNDLKQLYESADIVIDQLRIGWYGVATVEAMSLGKPVVCYIREDLKHHIPELEEVLINANPNNLYESLKLVIENRSKAVKISKKARAYAVKNHDQKIIAQQYLDLYNECSKNPKPINMGLLNTYLIHQLNLMQVDKKSLQSNIKLVAQLKSEDAGLKAQLSAKSKADKSNESVSIIEHKEDSNLVDTVELKIRKTLEEKGDTLLKQAGLYRIKPKKDRKDIFDYPIRKAPARILKRIKNRSE